MSIFILALFNQRECILWIDKSHLQNQFGNGVICTYARAFKNATLSRFSGLAYHRKFGAMFLELQNQ